VVAASKAAVLPAHSQGMYRKISRPGIEPGPGPSEGPMRSVTPSGIKAARWLMRPAEQRPR